MLLSFFNSICSKLKSVFSHHSISNFSKVPQHTSFSFICGWEAFLRCHNAATQIQVKQSTCFQYACTD